MTVTTIATIGTLHDASRAVLRDSGYECQCGCAAADERLAMYGDAVTDDDPRYTARVIGSGESRTAYLVNGVVYKVGRDSANDWEHDFLGRWRDAGAEWAPQTSLHKVTILVNGDGDTEQYLVVAMPYLPDDGGEVDEATLAAITVAAPHVSRVNYTSHGGRTYLIDGGDIERDPRDVR